MSTSRPGAHAPRPTATPGPRREGRLRRAAVALLLTMVAAVGLPLLAPVAPAAAATGDPCAAPVDAIACENTLPGTPEFEWQIEGAGDPDLQGFATEISVQAGDTIDFKVDTGSTDYFLNVYRLGWYGGDGARLVEGGVLPSAPLPQTQPECLFEVETRLTDCGNWDVSASWTVPTDAVSGVYLAHVKRNDTDGQSHIVFVVRDDASTADVVFQTADTTWQAYNRYGGYSLYPQSTPTDDIPRAFKVSYNRPFTTADYKNQDWLFNAEYPMIRYLERNGFDVTYTSGIDTDRGGVAELTEHQVFLSVGHDEYWSEAQRENVEAARDAGTHLQFLGGNDVYWKTRYEPSLTGDPDPYRTLVSYKETFAGAKIDPSEEWTGTWRDDRFSPPYDGGRPENELIGTIFTVNAGTSAIEVPAEEGRMRFWRDTSIAELAPGEVAVLTEDSLGYEWNEDLDNGFRPAGTFRLSDTVRDVPDKLADPYGATTSPGTARHNMTLYRADSGALVFSAGSIQWPYALEGSPGGSPASPAAKQAMVNLFADMGVQPATLEAGLTPATASTDTVAPSISMTTPIDGSEVGIGDVVVVSGTASDASGEVAGVEVTVDGGATWHRAEGRGTWTYEWTADAIGDAVIAARAVDDSANLSQATPSVVVGVGCPCTLFPETAVPSVVDSGDGAGINVGTRFNADVPGQVSAIRFYKAALNTGPHRVDLWTSDGTLLAQAPALNTTIEGWQEVPLENPVLLTPGVDYVVSYHAPNGHYSADAGYFANSGVDTPPLHAPATTVAPNGVYAYGSQPAFPDQTFGGTNYWVEPVFVESDGPDTFEPVVASLTPANGEVDVALSTTISARFNEDVVPDSISFSLTDQFGAPVAGAGSYDPATRTWTFVPDGGLAGGTTYTGALAQVSDLVGNVMSTPTTWSFQTAGIQVCPCTLYPAGATPANPAASDTDPIEVGTRFRSDDAGYVFGVRFWKGQGNGGTHVGNLWGPDGQLLASGTFLDETTSGWQELTFIDPVAIEANTIYTVSYFAPQGRYSYDGGYFSEPVNRVPLRAVVDDPEDLTQTNINGVYRYASASTYPALPGGGTSYWVEPVFNQVIPPDVTAPDVRSIRPADGATGVGIQPEIRVRFTEPVLPESLAATLDGPSGAVALTTTYDVDTMTATFDPVTDLALGADYVLSLVGATDRSGNELAAPVTASFRTKSCPCTVFGASTVPDTPDGGDYQAIEVGMRFSPTVDGLVQGVRFYKSLSNTGTHIGNLWTEDGELLASRIFSSETAAGWQTVTFEGGVPVTAGTTYVVSYHAPDGGYASTPGYFDDAVNAAPLLAPGDGRNGLYRYGGSAFPDSTFANANYWVDPIFVVDGVLDTTAPVVGAQAPVDGAVDVLPNKSVSATFSEPVQPGSIAFEMTGPSGPLPGTTEWDFATRTATFRPDAGLASSTTYTVSVTATDLAGNPTPAPATWSFTTADPQCPCTLFAGAEPTSADGGDDTPTELGVKFTADVEGSITGVRFYKSVVNVGTHVGRLWTEDGVLLAEGTFGAETASGWQEMSFDVPVTVQPGTTYVASYFAPQGRYAADKGFFTDAGVSNAPLRAPRSSLVGGNGVFRSGSAGFPTDSFQDTNYWVEPVFDLNADLALTYEQLDPFVANEEARYALTATNFGPDDAAGPIVVENIIPVGTTYRSVDAPDWDCTLGERARPDSDDVRPALFCEQEGPFPVGTSSTITVTVLVDANPVTSTDVWGTVHSATVDPDSSNDILLVPSEIAAQRADLGIVVTRPGELVRDAIATWTLTVSNAGPDVAYAPVTVEHRLPAGLEIVATGGEGWTCEVAADPEAPEQAEQVVTCTIPELVLAGESLPVITTEALVLGSAADLVTDTASVSSPTYDPDTTDDVDAATTPVVTLEADLSATVTATAPVRGETASIQVTVRNDGPSAAAGPITVTATLDEGLRPTGAAGAGWTCTTSGQTVTCTTQTALADGDSLPALRIDGVVGWDAPAQLVHDLGWNSQTVDPDPSDDQQVLTQAVTGVEADLGIGLVEAETFVRGTVGTLVVTVTGPDPVPGAAPPTVDVALSDGLTFAGSGVGPWACAPTEAGAACTFVGDGGFDEGVSRFTLSVYVDPEAPESVSVQAVVSSGVHDPDPTDDATTWTGRPETLYADLSISMQSNKDFVAGETVQTKFTVANAGPDKALAELRVHLDIGPGLVFVTDRSDRWLCAEVADGVDCVRNRRLNRNAKDILHVVTRVAEDAPAATHLGASVSTPSQDTDPSNDSVVTQIAPQASSADLVASLSAPSTVSQDASGTFLLQIENRGAETAQGPIVAVVDLGPELVLGAYKGHRKADDRLFRTKGWTCLAVGTIVTCELDRAMQAGQERSLELTVDPSVLGSGQATVTATVTSQTPDARTADNVSSATTTIESTGGSLFG